MERGNGVALVPRLTVDFELGARTLVAVQVPELHMERRLRLVHRRRTTLSHAAKAFLAVVEAHAKAQGAPFCFEEERRR